jgi:two-component system, NtrC family, nitrogen regulation sensor histidine kinase NtrY
MTLPSAPSSAFSLTALLNWASRAGLGKQLAFALSAAALAAGVATYAALTQNPLIGAADPTKVILLLTLDLVLLLLLGMLVARRLVRIWIGRKRGHAGSRLHVRLVLVFSLLAAAPAIFMAVFAAVFLQVGIQSWFSDKVRTAVNESLAVATAYLHEHQQNIRADALAMANDINQDAPWLAGDPARLERIINTQVMLRALSEAAIFHGETRRVAARSGLTFSLELEGVTDEVLETARGGEVALIVAEQEDRVRAVVRLDRFVDTYLYIGRLVEPRVLAHMEAAQGAVRLYSELEGRRGSLQVTFTLVFVVVALLLLLAAVWAGLNLASKLVGPIGTLIGAAERVRSGDLTVRVEEPKGEDELALLARAFNRMTTEIEEQRRELLRTNAALDERRRFTETVLFGVSAGVIGLDGDGVVNLPNMSAARLLGVDDPEKMIGRHLSEFSAEMAELLTEAPKRAGRLAQDQVHVRRPGRGVLTLLVRIAEEGAGRKGGYVVTFDDITELVSAQRMAAWADVARRIAHEIKNPLTPIQLSAERLRRRYLKEISGEKELSGDTEVFTLCTDTIIRQVDDIRRMVDEFSAFARMPQPVMKPVDLLELIKQAVFLQASAHAGKIRFETDLPAPPVTVPCDSRQVAQALTNLLQNAADAIEGREPPEEGAPPLPGGVIKLRVAHTVGQVVLSVEDNGKGLPTEQRDRLTEPYVTTRAKGTGLGLAIVKKIMEDHGGALALDDGEAGGARVSLAFPSAEASSSSSSSQAPLNDAPAAAPADGQTDARLQAHGA